MQNRTRKLAILALSLSSPGSPSFSLPLKAPRRRRGDDKSEERPATSKELAILRDSLRSALLASGYAGAGRNASVVAELESSLLRAGLTSREATLWLAALAALGRPRSPQRQKTR